MWLSAGIDLPFDVEFYLLTDLPLRRVGLRALLRMARSRWSIETQGFNDATNRYAVRFNRILWVNPAGCESYDSS